MPKKPIFGELAKLVSLRLYSWEKEPVKEFIKKMRDKRKKQLRKARK